MEEKDFVLKIPMQVREKNGKYLAYFPGWDVSAEGETEEEARVKARKAAAKRIGTLESKDPVIASLSKITTSTHATKAGDISKHKLFLSIPELSLG